MTREGLKNEINRLKKKREAVILAHNYQRREVQDVADYLGDSLDLSRTAARTDAEVAGSDAGRGNVTSSTKIA